MVPNSSQLSPPQGISGQPQNNVNQQLYCKRNRRQLIISSVYPWRRCSTAKSCPTLCNPVDCSTPGSHLPPSPGVCSSLCPWRRWCHPAISPSFRPLLLLPSVFLASGSFSTESALRVRWPKYRSFAFSISPSNECSGLASFRTDWFDLLAVQWILKSSLATQFESICSLVLSLLYGPTLTSLQD